jgi:hypothetical protein
MRERHDDDLESSASHRECRPGKMARVHVADIGQLRSRCDSAALGWRAIAMLRRLDESDNGSPILDRFGDSSPDAREAWGAVLGDAVALVAEASGTN